MRRGLERYAPEEGFDPGPHARDKIAQLVVRKAGVFPGDWVLDVQTGTGLLGVNLARALKRVRVVATDDDREALERARENAQAEGCMDRLRLVQCLPDALPFKDEFSYYSTVGFALAAEEEPLDVLDELHRTTGFYGKVYAAALDLRKSRAKKQRGVKAWVFDDETLAELRAIGFGKVQMQQVAVLQDGGRLMLVTTKRFDPEEEDDEEDEEEEDIE
ncbi:MAG TPA: class I SAM-dependent methyltransferase [Candidatus Thermoplasmatota archaeon]|nr:class I SAM-dependent methyltransferase [Candidatus Thermoplasmatota archaeon]